MFEVSSRNAQPSKAAKHRLPQVSLRTLLVLMGLLGIGLGYCGNRWRHIKRQQQIVTLVKSAGGEVRYSYQFGMGDELGADEDGDWTYSFDDTPGGLKRRWRDTSTGRVEEVETPPGPQLLRAALGRDAFAQVEEVSFIFQEPHTSSEFDPHLLLELPQLKVVAPSRSQVNDRWIKCIANVPQLKQLLLYGGTEGTVSQGGLACLQSANNLEVLQFGGKWVRDENVSGIANLHQLQSLTISDSPLVTSALFSNLDELTDLRELIIRGVNKVDDQGAEHLSRLHKLHTLWLSDTSISDATLAHLPGLTQLEWLSLSATRVGDPGMEYVAKLSNLQKLDLAETMVGDTGVHSLSSLSQLRYLNLGETRITNAAIPVISQMTSLEVLHLWPVSVTDAGLSSLKSLRNLKRLQSGPHVSKEAANQLRKALPHCRVDRIDENGSSSYPDD